MEEETEISVFTTTRICIRHRPDGILGAPYLLLDSRFKEPEDETKDKMKYKVNCK
jgi:hypothetical protein